MQVSMATLEDESVTIKGQFFCRKKAGNLAMWKEEGNEFLD